MRRSALLLALALAVAVLPLAAPAAGCSDGDWPMFGHDSGHSFAQPAGCAAIDTANVSTLTPKWFVKSDAPVSASPTVVDGVLYVGDWSGKFMALDAGTGQEIWSFQVDDPHAVPFGRIVSSAAIDEIKVDGLDDPVRAVLFAGGATLYALDPATGALLAKVDTDPRDAALRAQRGNDDEVEIESSPVVGHFPGDDDRIFVGMDVHNGRDVGRTGLLSFELKKSAGPTPLRFELKYKFDPETRTLRYSLTDGSGTGFGCGGVWSSPALDATALGGDGVIVFGTSNCEHNTESVSAGEVGSEGVFGIAAKTGALLWEYHPRGANPYDDDFGASPNLLPVTIGGDKIVGEGGKDGSYYAFSLTGSGGLPDVKWASHLGQAGHLTDQFAFGGILSTPAVGEVASPLGGHEPAVFAATALSTPVGEPVDSGGLPLDPSLAEDPGRMFSLHAISAVDGRVLWRTPLSRQSFGAPTYTNGVVFVPSTFDFSVKAFHADTGALLWQHVLNGPPASPPAIVGDSIYLGVGVTANALPIEALSGIWAFDLAGTPAQGSGVLLSAHANQLDAYDLAEPVPATSRTTPIHSHTHDPGSEPGEDTTGHGNDSNGQICRFTQSDGETYYLLGEDSDQADLPNGVAQGWGVYRPDGGVNGPWTLVDKIVPQYDFIDPPNTHLPDNTGCAVSADGNSLFTVDLGEGAFPAGEFGSLFQFFRDANGDFSSSSPYCVLDDDLMTAGYLAIDPNDGSVLVPQSGSLDGGAVVRYSPPFPAGGGACSGYDLEAKRSDFITGIETFVPISIARRNGMWLVGNVAPGQINEYDAQGNFVRPIVVGQPPGVAGIAVDEAGNVYWANLGLVPCETVLCPVDGAGSLWKVAFDALTDAPTPPILIMPGLTYPEGLSAFPSL